MREMVLNHASLTAAGWRDAMEWLRDMAAGVAAVVENGAATPFLRVFQTMDQIRFRDNRTLVEVCFELRRRGESRDQRLSLMDRMDKAHFQLEGLGREVEKRLGGCRSTEPATDDSAPLVLCAMTGAISVSVPSEPTWDRDRIPVEFTELGPGPHRRVEIDNVARPVHARSVADRDRQRLRRQCSSNAQLWSGRAALFPHLRFGLDVGDHLARLNPGLLSTLVNRLADLDDTAADWRRKGDAKPRWRCQVTPWESVSVRNHPRWREQRQFRSADGEYRLFLPHVQLGSDRRIHLRIDGPKREIEVGYIGKHRRTKKYKT